MKANIEKAAFQGQKLTREQLAQALRNDVQGAVVVISEVLQHKDLFEALVEVYYNRYLDLMESEAKNE